MQNTLYDQILILFFQCLIVASLLLFLFRLRTVFGLSLLFTALGVFQYMQVFLAGSLYIEVTPGILVSPGSTVLFSGSLFAILIIYIREDAIEARKVIYAILAANIVLIILQIVFSWTLGGEGVKNIYNLPKELFIQNTRVILIGTFVLFFDSFIVIVLYEAISRYVSILFLRILFSMALILSIDSLLFSFGAFAGTNQFLSILISGLISKNSAAFVYSIIFTIYLVYLEKDLHKKEMNTNSFKDIFYTLTYRQKYEHVFKEKEIQKIALLKSEELFRTIVEKARNVIYVISHDGKLKSINPAFEELTGWSVEEWINQPFTQLVHTDDLYLAVESFKNIMNGKNVLAYELRIRCKSGKYKIGEFTPSPLTNGKDIVGALGIATDITERKKIEVALRESEEKYRTLVSQSPEGIFIVDLNGNFISTNRSMYESLGYDEKEFLSMNIWDIIPKEYEIQHKSRLKKILLEGGIDESAEYKVLGKNGTEFIVEISSVPYHIAGKLKGIQGVARDITKQKKAESALRESEEKFYKAFHNSPDAITITRASDGLLIEVNESFYRISGYSRDEVIGHFSVDLNLWVSLEDHDRYISILKEKKRVTDFETLFRTKTGEERNYILAGEIIELKGEVCIIGILHDVTERKRTEEKIKKSREELRSLSTHLQTVREEERTNLAREMHDEIGQILTSIKMNLSLIRRQVKAKDKKFQTKDLDNEIKSMSEMVDHAVVRVRKMITELRPELLDKLGLIPALEWYAEEFERESKIKCTFKSDFDELSLNHNVELTIFRIVQEALTNVTKHSKAKHVSVNIKKNKGGILIEIVDNGIGITEDLKKGENSFGLIGMRERAYIVGGKLEIVGVEGKGTTVKLVISY